MHYPGAGPKVRPLAAGTALLMREGLRRQIQKIKNEERFQGPPFIEKPNIFESAATAALFFAPAAASR
ncbi:hypothetical protein [Pseudacidovorax intermedius]|uniref:hypothetical protein n=1 Tax=Pseudacidovorax intermedius TaxID=433924 RepID=UPI0019D40F32|nr:hypothetical protein [Pseudacidovorax intermedius]